MTNLFFLWQAAAPDNGAGGNPLLLPTIAIGIGIFYFFMIRPQIKEQKEQKNFADNLKKGNKVVTIGGIHGTIASVEDDGTVTILIAPKTVVTAQRSSISQDATKAAYGESFPKNATAKA